MHDTLKTAIVAAKAGQSKIAEKQLRSILREDPSNITAWLWLASVIDESERKIYCLEQVLRIDPQNRSAQLGLRKLSQKNADEPYALHADPASTPSIEQRPGGPLHRSTSRFRLWGALVGIFVFLFVGLLIGAVLFSRYLGSSTPNRKVFEPLEESENPGFDPEAETSPNGNSSFDGGENQALDETFDHIQFMDNRHPLVPYWEDGSEHFELPWVFAGIPTNQEVFIYSNFENIIVHEGLNPSQISSMTWSPDGSRMAFFVVDPEQKKADLWISDLLQNTALKLDESIPIALEEYGVPLAWSPDGTQIAYFASYPEFGGSIVQRLFVIRSSGNAPPLLLHEQVLAFSISWDPASRYITVSAIENREQFTQLFILDSATGDHRRLTNDFNYVIRSAWSPDGQNIAFLVSNEAEDHFDLHLIGPQGDNRRQILDGFGGDFRHEFSLEYFILKWSPTGQEIALATFFDDFDAESEYQNLEVQVLNLNSGVLSFLTDEAIITSPFRDDNYRLIPILNNGLVWSPDGSRIAYRNAIPVQSEAEFQIYLNLVSPDGSGPLSLIPCPTECLNLAWIRGAVDQSQPVVDSNEVVTIQEYIEVETDLVHIQKSLQGQLPEGWELSTQRRTRTYWSVTDSDCVSNGQYRKRYPSLVESIEVTHTETNASFSFDVYYVWDDLVGTKLKQEVAVLGECFLAEAEAVNGSWRINNRTELGPELLHYGDEAYHFQYAQVYTQIENNYTYTVYTDIVFGRVDNYFIVFEYGYGDESDESWSSVFEDIYGLLLDHLVR